MPPVRSGIADYTRDLVAALTGDTEMDVFVATSDEVDAARETGAPARYATAHDFPWRHHRAPYDLTIFQMGNSWCHDFMWPYLFRYPGLVVLHDGHLHHARAWSLLRRGRSDDYRAELAFNHPELPREAAEAALAGLGGTLYYFWPMLRSVVTSARAVAVHSEALADEIRQAWGVMISEGRNYIATQWWLATVPAAAILAVVGGFNLLGDGLRDLLDPRLRGR